MKFKLLLFVAIIAIAMIGIYTPDANAQGPGVAGYANAKMWTGITMYDKDSSGKVDDTGEATSDMDLYMATIIQSTIGVKGSVNNVFVDLALMAGSPFGTSPADSDQAFQFIVAIMYNIGEAQLMVGQHFGPYDIVNPNDPACKTNSWDFLAGYTFFDAVREQIRVTYKGLYVGLFQNSANGSSTADVMLPMISAGYSYGNPGTPMHFQVHGLYQTYTVDEPFVDDGTGTGTMVANPLDGNAVAGYGVGGKFGMNMGAISFYVTGLYGVNPANMGFGALGGAAVAVGDEFKNTTVMAGHGGFTYAMGAVRISAGAGYKSITYDSDVADDPDTQMTYFVSLKYALQPNFTVTPVIQIEDRMENQAKVKEGKVTVIGALFEANI